MPVTYSELCLNVSGCAIRVRADASKNATRKASLLAPACLTSVGAARAIYSERYVGSFCPSLRGFRLLSDNAFWSLHEGPSKKIITIKPTAHHRTITAVLNPDMDRGEILLSHRQDEWLITRLWKLLIDNVLSRNGIFAFHASAVADGSDGYVFLGSSGAGKTTMSKLWRAKHAIVVHDDRVILSKTRGHVVVSSAEITRRQAAAGSILPRGIRVKKLFFIKHGKENKIFFMDQRSILKALALQSRSLIWSSAVWKNIAGFYADLASSVAGYGIEFVPDVRCVDFIRGHK
jgi:hypothetical protein